MIDKVRKHLANNKRIKRNKVQLTSQKVLDPLAEELANSTDDNATLSVKEKQQIKQMVQWWLNFKE